MEKVLLFLVVFVFIYLVYLVTIIWRDKKGQSIFKNGQASLIISKYRLDVKRLNMKKFHYSLAFCNSFIIALTFTLCDFLESLLLKLLFAFILLIPLILIVYHFIGRRYQKLQKEGK